MHTDECVACTQRSAGMRAAKVPHGDKHRKRTGELMADDDDQQLADRGRSEERTVETWQWICRKLEKRRWVSSISCIQKKSEKTS